MDGRSYRPNRRPGRAGKEAEVTRPVGDVSSRDETLCAAPGCAQPVHRNRRGRPALYCSTACRAATHRKHHQRQAEQPVTVEVDHGSTSAKGRTTGRVWLVRLRRGERTVIVAAGLGRPSADHLARQISDLLGPPR
jgi:hypothetical protein